MKKQICVRLSSENNDKLDSLKYLLNRNATQILNDLISEYYENLTDTEKVSVEIRQKENEVVKLFQGGYSLEDISSKTSISYYAAKEIIRKRLV
jgi:predicted DNA-binding protein